MKRPVRIGLLSLLLIFLALAWTGAQVTKTYRDPGEAFSLQIPTDWTVQRTSGDAGWTTIVSSSSARRTAKLVLLANPFPSVENYRQDVQESTLRGLGQPYFQGWFKALQGQARVEISRKVYKTWFKGAQTLRMDVSYYKGDRSDPRQAYALFFCGKRTVFFAVPSGDRVGFAEADRILSTLQIEPSIQPR